MEVERALAFVRAFWKHIRLLATNPQEAEKQLVLAAALGELTIEELAQIVAEELALMEARELNRETDMH